MWRERGCSWRAPLLEPEVGEALTRSQGPWAKRRQAAASSLVQSADFSCDLTLAPGTVCGKKFTTRQQLVMHQLRSRGGGEHGQQHPVFRCIHTNMCPVCRSTFSTPCIAKQHLYWAYIKGYCKVDLSTFSWPLRDPKCLQCSTCGQLASSSGGPVGSGVLPGPAQGSLASAPSGPHSRACRA